MQEEGNVNTGDDLNTGGEVLRVNIENQMKTAYIDYSMSVIVSRALPDVRDGLKPVHRRVLYGMLDLGVLSNRPYKKSARIVGDVLGKYHPHGDSSVYGTMVRMAQWWSMRYLLVDGQGNYGSMDGDSPAAMRYTEARMQKISEEITRDIDKNTVDFQLNFDDSLEEPTVMPTRIPNLLINGTSGIAVGMATNMAPHNLTEVMNGCIAYIDNNEMTVEDMMGYVKAPDFPTGGIIYGFDGVRQAFETGRGRVVMRGNIEIEEGKNGSRDKIIATSLPYQVNKADMIQKTADLVNEKKIEGIADLRDESDRNGIRVVYELKRDAVQNVVINKLYQYTALQSSFSINNVALVKGRPETLTLLEVVGHFIEHRHDVVVRRTQYELDEAEKKAHILEGLIIALNNLDEVIKLIRSSKTPEEARNGLISRFELSELQARAILDMRLQKLTGLEIDKIREEYTELMKVIDYLRSILGDKELRMTIIKDELIDIRDRFGDERRSTIEYAAGDFNIEDTIPDEEVVVTISHMGYVKRTPLTEYRVQNRGGRGARGSSSRQEDFIEGMFVATNHNYILFFTEMGKVYWLRVFEVPEGTKTSKGRAIQNLIQIDPNDKLKAYVNVKSLSDEEYINNNFIVMCTKGGRIKKTTLEAYSRPRLNGINAITVREGDELIEAKLTNGESDILIGIRSGRAIRFPEAKVRPMGRTASGVRGITITEKKDEVIGMVIVADPENESILVISENGYGKRSDVDDYRITNRGGKGVKTINITEKTGSLVAIKAVEELDNLMIINKSGITIRINVASLRVMGRAAQGVKTINIQDGDQIAAVAHVAYVESVEEDIDEDVEIVEGELESEETHLEDNTDNQNSEESQEDPTENQ